MPNPENLKGKGFDKHPENINKKGRPPKKLVSIINRDLKNEGFAEVTKSEVTEAFLTLLNLPLSKINEIAKQENDEYPFLFKFVAKELLGNKGQDMLKEILDRGLGKAKENIEQTVNKKINDSDREEIIKRLKDEQQTNS